MELSILTQLTVSIELSILTQLLLLTQIPFGLFLLSENLLSFLSRMNLTSTPLIYRIR